MSANVYRRDFAGGAVAANANQSGSFTINFGKMYLNETGAAVSSVTLGATAGTVLRLIPMIIQQPQSRMVAQGNAITFQVVVTAQNPLTYQWSHNGAPIVAATNATLLITNVQPSQAGLYAVAITNSFAGVVSAPAALAVMSSTGPGAPGFTSNRFGFTVNAASSLVIVMEACTNLANPAWSPVQTNTFAGESAYFSDSRWTNYPARFYRLRWP